MNTSPSSAAVPDLVEQAARALDQALRESGKPLAEICRLTRDRKRCIAHQPKVVAKWFANEGEGRLGNPLLRAAVILRVTKDPLPLQWLCGQIGGVVVPGSARYGKRWRGKTLPADVGAWPELTEWLAQTGRILVVRQGIQRMVVGQESISMEAMADFLMSWLSVKGWIEGYLNWTGHPGPKLERMGKPTVVAEVTDAWTVVRHAFGQHQHPNEIPHTMSIAADLHISKSSVQKWGEPSNPEQSGSANPFDHVAQLTKATGSLVMVEWLCQVMGGGLQSAAVHQKAGKTPWPQVYWEIIELEHAASRALLDNDVDPTEAKVLRKEWDDVRSWMAEFVKTLQERCPTG